MELPPELTAWEKQELIQQVKEGCLTGLVRCLAFQQRMAFILHVLMQLPIQDVADILGKSDAATKVLIHRARRNLKNFLGKNCSVYDPANPCQCEELVGLCLRQGWIERSSSAGKRPPEPQQIEAEIKGIREVVELYTSFSVPQPAEELRRRIQQYIFEQAGTIFNAQKV